MKERPILFSATMVRAILDGRKTMTRRVVKFNRPFVSHHFWDYVYPHPGGGYIFTDGPLNNPERDIPVLAAGRIGKMPPYGQPGDRLWVRENFSYRTLDSDARTEMLWYWADGQVGFGNWSKPKPSIHMPRWASRITLEVSGVRVERVQEITEEDAKAEGVDGPSENPLCVGNCRTAYSRFRDLWDSINAKLGCGWDANPWVWVIEFRRVNP